MRQVWEIADAYSLYIYVGGILMFLSYGIPLSGVFKIQKIQGW